MKELVLHALILILFFGFFSCNDEESPTNKPYLEITVNGNQYSGNIGETNFLEQQTCDNKSSFIIDVGEVETPDIFFQMRIMHYSLLDDFISKGEGNYEIKKIGIEDLCHFDGDIYYKDKTQTNYTTSVKSGGVNTITDIQKLEELGYIVIYAVQGYFNVTIVNSIEEEFTVTGKYNIHLVVYQQD